MNWSKEWGDFKPPDKEFKLPDNRAKKWQTLPDNEDAVQIGYDDNQVAVTLENGDFIGTLVGDLVVYEDWGSWHVAHYPTQTRFDDVDKGAVPLGNWTKEQLLSWCDKVQTKHGSLWAILRELTPETAHDKSDRVMKAKDQIRDWCLSCQII